MDHPPGERGGLRFYNFLITPWTSKPILDLKDQGINNMQQNTQEKNDLKHLYHFIGNHKMGRFVEDHGIIIQDHKQVEAHMDHKECD